MNKERMLEKIQEGLWVRSDSKSRRSEGRDTECAGKDWSDKDKLKQLVSISCILEWWI